MASSWRGEGCATKVWGCRLGMRPMLAAPYRASIAPPMRPAITGGTSMLKRTLMLIAALAAAFGVFAGGAFAAGPAPGLDGETIQPWIGEPKPVVSCLYDASRSTLTIGFQLNGGATGPYWPGFTMKAAGQFAVTGAEASLTSFDAPLTL